MNNSRHTSRAPWLLVAASLLLAALLAVSLAGKVEPDEPTYLRPLLTEETTSTTTAPYEPVGRPRQSPTTTAPPRRLTKSGAVYPTDELLDRLAYCETGGTMDPATNTGNGFYGAFQFTIGTWWSVGGEGYPHEHPYEVQRELARTLILQAGWGQFPHCSRAIGAR